MSKAPLSGLFFKPVQVRRQLTNLLMQLRNQLLLVLRPGFPRLKQFGQVIPNGRPPLGDLRRMHRILSRGSRDRFQPHPASNSTLALKAALCRFRFAFIHLLFLIYSRPAKIENTRGLKIGVHL